MKTATKTKKRDITTFVPVFGSNRTNADKPGELLKGCKFVAIAFAGGMSEVRHMKARTIVVNDRHSHIINCAMVAADPKKGPALYRKLRKLAFHPVILRTAQQMCLAWESSDKWDGVTPILPWAIDYFICAWMARNGTAATDDEFKSGLSIRWDAGGGDSCVRFRSATEALKEWRAILARCTFQCLDCFTFLEKVGDAEENGVYCDPPWPGDGLHYKHKFTEAMQRRLAEKLHGYEKARVVIRYGDHPLIRELYPEPRWTWRDLTGRTQHNNDKAEVLITNFA